MGARSVQHIARYTPEEWSKAIARAIEATVPLGE